MPEPLKNEGRAIRSEVLPVVFGQIAYLIRSIINPKKSFPVKCSAARLRDFPAACILYHASPLPDALNNR